MKSLPKPNAKDDIEKAELAKREVSTLKKELQKCSSMQKQRLKLLYQESAIGHTIRGRRYFWRIQL